MRRQWEFSGTAGVGVRRGNRVGMGRYTGGNGEARERSLEDNGKATVGHPRASDRATAERWRDSSGIRKGFLIFDFRFWSGFERWHSFRRGVCCCRFRRQTVDFWSATTWALCVRGKLRRRIWTGSCPGEQLVGSAMKSSR